MTPVLLKPKYIEGRNGARSITSCATTLAQARSGSLVTVVATWTTRPGLAVRPGRCMVRWPPRTIHRPGLAIEAPWLVHGRHGASLTEHKAGGVFHLCAGFTMVYRYTRHQPHLVTALKLADFFVERMGAAFPDHVPNFDLTCQSAHPVVVALVWVMDVCGCS
jgi:hypothetical protein